MRYLFDANTIISEAIILDKELSMEEILNYSNYDIKAPDINTGAIEPFKKIRRNSFGEIENTIRTGYPFKGNIKDTDMITAGSIYYGKINNKLVKVLATETKAWVIGTEVADISMKEFTIKLLRGE